MNIANKGGTALYYAYAYQYCAQYWYLDLLGFEIWVIEVGLYLTMNKHITNIVNINVHVYC